MGRKTQGYRRWPAVKVQELPPGAQKIIEIDGRSIGLFNVKGNYRAVLNVCPHEMAPVCRGAVRGTTLLSPPGEYRWGREGEILACPWHQWEFDLLTGHCLVDKRRLHLFPVEIEDDTIYILLRPGRQGTA
jgi:3-phenylpropionate/trans-cinnamate dioxygenase ferredoxin subunit